jgi:hypothetical protein
MAFTQLTVRYNGFTGAPGWVKMKFMDNLDVTAANTAAANFRAFLFAIGTANIPTGANFSFDSVAQTFDGTGQLTGELNLTIVPAVITGANNSAYAGGAGVVVNWLTDAFVGGKRIRGRTFLVPLGPSVFAADGTVSDTFRTTLQTAATTFATSTPQPAVWSVRALGASPVYTIAGMQGATIPDRSALLRSRRD